MVFQKSRSIIPHTFVLLVVFGTGLAVNRLLFELFFPALAWIGRPFPALVLAALVAIVGWQLWRRLSWPLAPLLPLLLNLFGLLPTDLNPTRTAVILATSFWLTAGSLLAQNRQRNWWHWGPLLVVAALLPVYLLTVSHAVGRADSFEFQVVASQLGIAHPTGYPLFLLLGKLFTYIPISSIAWRLNFAAMVYGLVALSLLFIVAYRVLKRPLPALLSVVLIGLTPTFWRESIEAEIYTLHAIFVAAALWLTLQLIESGDPKKEDDAVPAWLRKLRRLSPTQLTIALAFTVGLSLTNHLTTLFLLPPAGIGLLLFLHKSYLAKNPILPLTDWRYWLKIGGAFLLPLTLYAYLPIRWTMLHGEGMGLARFIDWTTGGRFQDALQWRAWLDDPTRYEVIAQLFYQNWGEINLALAALGFAFLVWQQWRTALILFSVWLGYTFYSLNYYVPDLDVFILPAQLMVGLFWGAGLVTLLTLLEWLTATWSSSKRPFLSMGLVVTAVIAPLLLFVDNWPRVDQSADDGLLGWGVGVLAYPLEQNGAILADSEKIAPLYYLQQAEGVRPDLDIMVLPDESAYRQELGARLVDGQTVYLARYLPGLQGSYYLRSVGPLVEVATSAKTAVSPFAQPIDLDFGDVALVGYQIEPTATVADQETAVTLYWQAQADNPAPYHIYLRWHSEAYTSPPQPATGQYPVDNMYPANAWKGSEIVVDYHLLPQPVSPQPQPLTVQVAVAPAFTAAADLDWQPVAAITLPATPARLLPRPHRAQLGDIFVDGIDVAEQIRPLSSLSFTLSGHAMSQFTEMGLDFTLTDQPPSRSSQPIMAANRLSPFVLAAEVESGGKNGRFYLIGSHPQQAAYCGWLRPPTNGCILANVSVSGVAIPEAAINFDDQIALLDVEVSPTELPAGGLLDVILHWQSLAPISHDYTVFVQILDEQDRIVGQVDAWPRQGTYPTSQWTVGETIRDPYRVQLEAELAPGTYRLQVGWYLLATLRRLPVLDADGSPIDDKFVYPGLQKIE